MSTHFNHLRHIPIFFHVCQTFSEDSFWFSVYSATLHPDVKEKEIFIYDVELNTCNICTIDLALDYINLRQGGDHFQVCWEKHGLIWYYLIKVQRGEVMMNVIELHKEYLIITETVLCERKSISCIHIRLLLRISNTRNNSETNIRLTNTSKEFKKRFNFNSFLGMKVLFFLQLSGINESLL